MTPLLVLALVIIGLLLLIATPIAILVITRMEQYLPPPIPGINSLLTVFKLVTTVAVILTGLLIIPLIT